METIEQRIEAFSDEWQDYCLPDKVTICHPKINLFLEKNRNIEKEIENYGKAAENIFHHNDNFML